MSHLLSRCVYCGGSLNVHALLRLRRWSVRVAKDLTHMLRNTHNCSASRTHGEARVHGKHENAPAANTGYLELLHIGHGRAHRASDGGGSKRVRKEHGASRALKLASRRALHLRIWKSTESLMLSEHDGMNSSVNMHTYSSGDSYFPVFFFFLREWNRRHSSSLPTRAGSSRPRCLSIKRASFSAAETRIPRCVVKNRSITRFRSESEAFKSDGLDI